MLYLYLVLTGRKYPIYKIKLLIPFFNKNSSYCNKKIFHLFRTHLNTYYIKITKYIKRQKKIYYF